MEREVDLNFLIQKIEDLFKQILKTDDQIKQFISSIPEKIEQQEQAKNIIAVLLKELIDKLGLSNDYVPLFEINSPFQSKKIIFDITFPISKEELLDLVCEELSWFLILEGLNINSKNLT